MVKVHINYKPVKGDMCMKKKLLFTLAASVCALTCAFSLAACGDSTVKIEFTYKLNDDGNSYAITGATYDGNELYQSSKFKNRMPEEITVPSEYSGKPVTVIKTLGVGENVKNVNIPDSITEIGDRAFTAFFDISYLKIGDNIEKIGAGAFAGLEKLEVELSENSKLQSIGTGAFGGTAIKSFKAPATLKFTGGDHNGDTTNLFDSCAALETIDLSAITEHFTLFSGFAKNCPKLKTVILPNVRMSINSWAFDLGSADRTTVYTLFDPLEGAKNIFYSITGDDKLGLNDCAYLGNLYFYSETEPTGSSTYWWHYVNGVPTKW